MWKTKMTGVALVALLACGPVAAQEFTELDANEDALLDQDEFGAGLEESGIYEEWDADASGDLNQEEFQAGAFDAWDTDDDEALSEDEFAGASEQWYEQNEAGTFEEWDTNDNGLLDQDEFNQGAETTGLYDEWDANEDEALGEDEFGEGMYARADLDEDAGLSEEESEGWFDWF